MYTSSSYSESKMGFIDNTSEKKRISNKAQSPLINALLISVYISF